MRRLVRKWKGAACKWSFQIADRAIEMSPMVRPTLGLAPSTAQAVRLPRQPVNAPVSTMSRLRGTKSRGSRSNRAMFRDKPRGPSQILVPQPPDPTLAPSDPVHEMPEGNLEPRERLTPPSSFLAPGSPTLSKTGDSEEAGDGTVGTIFAVIGGVVFVGASLVMVGTAFRHACFRAMDPSQSPKPKAPKAPKGPSPGVPGVPRPRPLDPKIAPPASRPVAMWSLDEAMKPPNVAERWKLLKSQRVLPRDSRSTSAETPPRQSSVLEQSTEPIDNPDATPARFSKQLS